MSVSEMVVKVVGLVLLLVGLGLVLSVVGVNFLGIGLQPAWVAILVGVAFMAAGIYIIRGGTVTL